MIPKVLDQTIACYQIFSRRMPPRCRFYPSCSHYARLALERHGLATALYLIMRRLLKCQPFHPGGFDYP